MVVVVVVVVEVVVVDVDVVVVAKIIMDSYSSFTTNLLMPKVVNFTFKPWPNSPGLEQSLSCQSVAKSASICRLMLFPATKVDTSKGELGFSISYSLCKKKIET